MTWEVISKTSSIASLISIIPIFISLWLVVQIKGQRRKQLARIRKNPGDRPAFLIIDVVPTHYIRGQVESWIASQSQFDCFKNDGLIPADSIFHLNRDKPSSPDNLDDLIRDFRKLKTGIMQRGTDQLHMFCSAPIEVAAMIGAELSNTVPVILYHNTRNHNGYEDWGPMERDW